MKTVATKGVLFDLDDTLIDFQYARRRGLRALLKILPELSAEPIEELELIHDRELHANYLCTLDGSLSETKARINRMSGICKHYNITPEKDRLKAAATVYAREQESNRRVVPGASEILSALRGKARIGVITNGPSLRQREKLRFCGIHPETLDAIVISEEVGTTKPDPEIFHRAIDHLMTEPQQTVMIGDSWENDILGAINSGLRAIWINRYSLECPDSSLAFEINSLEPTDEIMEIIGY